MEGYVSSELVSKYNAIPHTDGREELGRISAQVDDIADLPDSIAKTDEELLLLMDLRMVNSLARKALLDPADYLEDKDHTARSLVERFKALVERAQN